MIPESGKTSTWFDMKKEIKGEKKVWRRAAG